MKGDSWVPVSSTSVFLPLTCVQCLIEGSTSPCSGCRTCAIITMTSTLLSCVMLSSRWTVSDIATIKTQEEMLSVQQWESWSLTGILYITECCKETTEEHRCTAAPVPPELRCCGRKEDKCPLWLQLTQ